MAGQADAAIVGVHEHPTRGGSGKNALHLQSEAAIEALAEAGLRVSDVDGLFSSNLPALTVVHLAEYLGIRPGYLDSTSIGGSSFLAHVGHAVAAVRAGRCKIALVTYGSTAASDKRPIGTGEALGAAVGSDHFENPYGPTVAANYAIAAQRHMFQYGTTSAQLAEVSVACRRHAALNPNAKYREPINIETVLNSRLIADPLHLLDCCIITDGAGALVVTSAERARDARMQPIYVLGAAESTRHWGAGDEDITVTAGAATGPIAFAQAGLKPSDVQMAMFYDSYTITVIMALEDMGFCKKGEGGAFVEDGRIQLGGTLPINTDGGGLSSNHPGMRGIFLIIEAVRQLRGDFAGTERQVRDCRYALAHGTGGVLGTRHSGATLLLGRDAHGA